MQAASFSDWAAAVCAALSLGAITAIPFLLWVDADYWLVSDWEPVRDRVKQVVWDVTRSEPVYPLLREWDRAKHAARDMQRQAAVTAAALLLLLAAPHSTEASR